MHLMKFSAENTQRCKTLWTRLGQSKNLSFMLQSSPVSQKRRSGKIIFILTIAAAIFWIIGKSINVYSSSTVGAIFEILWLPSLIILFILPIVSLIFLINEKFSFKSINLYSIIIAIVVVLSMMFIK